MNIKERFCSREVSKLLKEKGFNEPVHYEYHYTISEPQFHKKLHNFNGDEYSNCETEWFSAPTHQMALDWLRQVYNIHIYIEMGIREDRRLDKYIAFWNPTIRNILEPDISEKAQEYFAWRFYDDFKDAVDDSLLFILENLI